MAGRPVPRTARRDPADRVRAVIPGALAAALVLVADPHLGNRYAYNVGADILAFGVAPIGWLVAIIAHLERKEQLKIYEAGKAAAEITDNTSGVT